MQNRSTWGGRGTLFQGSTLRQFQQSSIISPADHGALLDHLLSTYLSVFHGSDEAAGRCHPEQSFSGLTRQTVTDQLKFHACGKNNTALTVLTIL